MSGSIRVFVADGDPLLREGLVCMLREEAGIAVIGAADGGDGALAQIKDLHPDVALVDIGMPEKEGIAVARMLRQEAPQVRVIILGVVDSTDEVMRCIEAGAAGYALKETSLDQLLETIRAAHRGEAIAPPPLVASLFSRVAELASGCRLSIPPGSVTLTRRELEIVDAIADGLSNKEIGQRLCIETQTVKNHVHNILDKLQLHSRLEAVEYAYQSNLLNENEGKRDHRSASRPEH